MRTQSVTAHFRSVYHWTHIITDAEVQRHLFQLSTQRKRTLDTKQIVIESLLYPHKSFQKHILKRDTLFTVTMKSPFNKTVF